MTTNRLAAPKDGKPQIIAPDDEDERRRFWIERGNRILWGQELPTKGGRVPPRLELEWACDNGHYSLVPRR